MDVLVVISVIAAVLILFGAADAFYEIACMKGHEQKKYFWWCFGMPCVGYLLVIALPDKKTERQEQKAPETVRTVTPFEPERKTDNPVPAVHKQTPAYQRPQEEEGSIKCPGCGRVQKADRSVCWECGAKFEK